MPYTLYNKKEKKYITRRGLGSVPHFVSEKYHVCARLASIFERGKRMESYYKTKFNIRDYIVIEWDLDSGTKIEYDPVEFIKLFRKPHWGKRKVPGHLVGIVNNDSYYWDEIEKL